MALLARITRRTGPSRWRARLAREKVHHAMSARACSVAHAARRQRGARRQQRMRREPAAWLHNLAARGAQAPAVRHSARGASTRKKYTTRCAQGHAAAWQLRRGDGEARGGSSAHARSQRHGSTSLRREARRREPSGRKESTRAKHTTQCALEPAAWRMPREGSGSRGGCSARPRSQRHGFTSSRHKARRCRQAARRARSERAKKGR